MHHMLEQTDSNNRTVRDNIKKIQIHGIEIQNYMFTIATTNMILRGVDTQTFGQRFRSSKSI